MKSSLADKSLLLWPCNLLKIEDIEFSFQHNRRHTMSSPVPKPPFDSDDSLRREDRFQASGRLPDRDPSSLARDGHAPQTPAPHWGELLAAPGIALSAALLCVSPFLTNSHLEHTSPSSLPPNTPFHRLHQNPEIAIAAKLGHTSHSKFLRQLSTRGYTAYAIRPNGIEVLYSNPRVKKADATLSSLKRNRNTIVTSGTFTAGDYIQSVGPIVRGGNLDTVGAIKGSFRGAIAVYDDGTFALGRTNGGTLSSIQERFFRSGRSVHSLLGGGALLIEQGSAVSSLDLFARQHFNQGGFGLDASQMRRTNHLVLGVRDGYCFVIVAHAKSAFDIQNDLLSLKFESAVKFDGGSGLFVNDRPGGSPRYRGRNTTGFIFTKWGVL